MTLPKRSESLAVFEVQDAPTIVADDENAVKCSSEQIVVATDSAVRDRRSVAPYRQIDRSGSARRHEKGVQLTVDEPGSDDLPAVVDDPGVAQK